MGPGGKSLADWSIELCLMLMTAGILMMAMGVLALAVPQLAGIAIGLVRPIALGAVLQGARMSHTARAFIGWFGPRGLNSLLLALLVVQAHVPAAEGLLAVTGVIVLVSVVMHGISATPLSNWYGRRSARADSTRRPLRVKPRPRSRSSRR